MKDAQEPKSPNRLINEISPYLLQHADNPVDWYAWGEEAFEKAVKEDKPIFLSVGYATCHWCHVMERESFNEEEIAQILNEHFVSVKVDREEHPDVDSVYMQAVMLFTGGHGGWPMSVFLTPDLKPFFGGTYFPKDQFKRILLETMKLWQNERQKVLGAAEEVSRIITSQLQTKVPSEAVDEQILKSAEDTLLRMVDKKWGGFTGAPKFPPHQTLEFFLRRYKATKRMPLLEVSELTLKQMAQGGIYDQIGGGFHRYSVDERWLVPHFEKMLYDNAQLAQIYAKVYTINDDLFFKKIADGIYNFVLREMTSPNGAFYSALDAESYLPSTSQKEEGAFYLWHPDEVISVLDKQDGELFCKIYDITNQPNFFNPHTGYKGSIPNLIKAPVENWGKAIKLNPNELWTKLDAMKAKLLEARNQRPRPLCDDKVLTDWNALMIFSFAEGYHLLGDERYLKASERAAEFLWTTLRKSDGTLMHSYRQGQTKVEGFLNDYAFSVVALLKLHEVTFQRKWLERAKTLADKMIQLFWDEQENGFWSTIADDKLIARTKSIFDSAEPSGNSMAVLGLIQLANRTGERRYSQIAKRSLEAFSGLMKTAPQAVTKFLCALDEWMTTTKEPIQLTEQPILRFWAEPDQLTVKSGETVSLKVHISLAKGWHVLGTTDLVGDAKLVSVESVNFPPPKKLKVKFTYEPLSVYEGTITVIVSVKGKTEGKDILKLKLNYQACDEKRCLMPTQMELKLPVKVTL